MGLRGHQAASAAPARRSAEPGARARSRSTARMSNSISAASVKRSAAATSDEAFVADRERLAVLGADVSVGDRLAGGGVGGGEHAAARLRPARRARRWRRARRRRRSRITQPRRSADIAAAAPPRPRHRRRSGALVAIGVRHFGDNTERVLAASVVAGGRRRSARSPRSCSRSAVTAATRSWSARSAPRPRSTCSERSPAPPRPRVAATARARCGSGPRTCGSSRSIASRTAWASGVGVARAWSPTRNCRCRSM